MMTASSRYVCAQVSEVGLQNSCALTWVCISFFFVGANRQIQAYQVDGDVVVGSAVIVPISSQLAAVDLIFGSIGNAYYYRVELVGGGDSVHAFSEVWTMVDVETSFREFV